MLWHIMRAGSECQPGEVIGRVVPPGTERTGQARGAQPEPTADDEHMTSPSSRMPRGTLTGRRIEI